MRRLKTILALLALPLLLAGCIERSYTVRTSPAEVTIMVDGKEVGTTPYTTYFLHYGTRQFIFSQEGHKRLVINQPIDPPWYEKFPVGMVTELFWPQMIHDHRDFHYRLEELGEMDKDALLNAADKMKARTADVEEVIE